MKRRINSLGNKSFTVTLPMKWIKSNRIKKHAEVDIQDKGHALLISADAEIKASSIQHTFTTKHIDEINFTIIGFYRAGYKEVRILFEQNSARLIEKAYDFVKNFQGVVCNVKDNCLTFYDKNDHSKCMSILRNGFITALTLCDHLNVQPKTNGWWDELLDGYKRLYFLTEFVFRLIGTEGYSDVRQTMKLYCTSWVLQCLGEIIKRIGKYEITLEKRNESRFSNGGHNMKIFGKVFREVYDICFSGKNVSKFYDIKDDIEKSLKKTGDDYLFREFFLIFSYLCVKMIKQQRVG